MKKKTTDMRSLVDKARRPKYRVSIDALAKEKRSLDVLLSSGELMGYSCLMMGGYAEIITYQGGVDG